jgi:hypothetical protein
VEVRTQTWGSPHVWLTAEEMAKLLSSSNDALTDKTLKDKAAQGVIRGHKIPGCNRWRLNPREVSEDIRNQGNEGFAVVKRRAKNKATEIIARHGRANAVIPISTTRVLEGSMGKLCGSISAPVS